MRAATIHGYGGPEVFRIETLERPAVGPRDVLVQVRAASVNPVDYKIRSGAQRALIRHRFPAVLGLDLSGVVQEVGSKVTSFSPGDEVFGSPTHRRQGTYAELVSVDERALALKPPRLSHEEAASLPLVGLTAWQCLVSSAKLKAGEKVLIQAGAGGVGTFAIQLAKHLGAKVATTCSSRNVELVRRLGADVVIDYTKEQFEDSLRDYDVVLESLGGEALPRARKVLKRSGRLVYISTGLPQNAARYGPYLGALATGLQSLSFWASTALSGRSARVVVRTPDGGQLEQIAALVEAGAIEPVIERCFELEEIAEAHEAIERGRTRGKLVIALKDKPRADAPDP